MPLKTYVIEVVVDQPDAVLDGDVIEALHQDFGERIYMAGSNLPDDPADPTGDPAVIDWFTVRRAKE